MQPRRTMRRLDIAEPLIEIVRANPCLYDVQVKGHDCKREREKVWRGIAEHFNLSVGQCKKRWQGLRDCYKRCHRMKKLGMRNATKWRFFGLLSFLDDVDVGKHTTSKDSTEKYDTEFSEFVTENDGTMHSTEETVSFATAAVNNLNTDCEDSLSHWAEPPTDSSCSSPSPDIAVNSRIDANDPIELYFLSLARQIKDVGLPKEMIINIEGKMSAYILSIIREWLKNKDKRPPS